MSNKDTISICSQLNLNTEQLRVQSLLQMPVYRRLFNIVLNDKNRTQYAYRKNLIKQLYFLLKITPIMKSQIRDIYLQKIQNWYNLNDHKKTQLGSGGLKNLIQGYFQNKQKNNQRNSIRPQSSIQWNKNIHPFLRPYTATRPKISNSRPDSYKSQVGRSTHASTKIDSNQQITTMKDFNLTIQQQWQASQQFVKKNRTIHPQAQPIYEQLVNIIKKAYQAPHNDQSKEDNNEHQILFQKQNPYFSRLKSVKMPTDNVFQKKKEQQKIQQNNEIQQIQGDQNQQSGNQEDNQQIQGVQQKKSYMRDLHQSKKRKQIQQFNFVKVDNQHDQVLLKKVNTKYLNFTNQKIVNTSKNDHQLVRHYVNYTRSKSAMKRQFNRKSQSKRLLSAKIQSASNLKPTITRPSNYRIYSALPRRTQNTNQFIEQKKNKIFYDFSRQSTSDNKQNHLSFITSPKYNQRKQLDQIYKRPIEKFKKFNKNTINVAEIKFNDKDHLLTNHETFLNRQKINPISYIHVEKHNQQTLQQLEKIKQRISTLGKISISTDSLVKALYINAYDDFQPIVKSVTAIQTQNNQKYSTQSLPKQFDWRNRNVYFNMISDGTKKKLKKKSRKLKKKVV